LDDHTEATLTQAILKTWPMSGIRQPRHLVAVQVNNGAGFSYGRTIDAVVMDTWPSSGLYLYGLEIKTNKADLRRELQNPAKFNGWAGFIDFFSIIAPKGIVDLKLLPERWGLYLPTDAGTLRARRKPLMLHDDQARMKTMPRSIVAAFGRALVTRAFSADGQKAEYDRGFENGKLEHKIDLNVTRKKLETLEEVIANFEEISGVRINSYDHERIGEAVKMVLRGGLSKRIGYSRSIRDLGERMLVLADELDAFSDAFDKGS
ncbi:hypothetical protein LCGC14_2770320, partial [marine sediment metagenome]